MRKTVLITGCSSRIGAALAHVKVFGLDALR